DRLQVVIGLLCTSDGDTDCPSRVRRQHLRSDVTTLPECSTTWLLGSGWGGSVWWRTGGWRRPTTSTSSAPAGSTTRWPPDSTRTPSPPKPSRRPPVLTPVGCRCPTPTPPP